MDPVTVFTFVTLALKTADEVGQLIAKLQDHQRTLEQAESDRKAARADVDADVKPAILPPFPAD